MLTDRHTDGPTNVRTDGKTDPYVAPCLRQVRQNSYDHTCDNTLGRMPNTADNVQVNNAYSNNEIMFTCILKAIKSRFKGT